MCVYVCGCMHHLVIFEPDQLLIEYRKVFYISQFFFPGVIQGTGYSFEFKISYKFLRLSDARIRYGNATQRSYRGKLHSGTYCDRLLESCLRRPCRIQSPNYPGIYPRNVSCHYRIREKNVPSGKHALIAVRQANYHYKEHVTKFDNSDRVFR